jgi:hypothetical protein
MKSQNFQNHRRIVPLFHLGTSLLVVVALIGSIINFYHALKYSASLYVAVLLCLLGMIAILFFWFIRSFALRAQDRAIRAEENLRHYALTGKLLNAGLQTSQIVALRFASDEEFVLLAEKAAAEKMNNNDIKKAIKNWKADYHRV